MLIVSHKPLTALDSGATVVVFGQRSLVAVIIIMSPNVVDCLFFAYWHNKRVFSS